MTMKTGTATRPEQAGQASLWSIRATLYGRHARRVRRQTGRRAGRAAISALMA
ncbi:hypothetical protein [Komagataeibacter nataicola]|uniref:hypothetical protein n=1 Tax=Komagataeibacter nataicola TaxID=265960 RepID=UPI0028AF405C|nr:hypothetical protein [Komagataeibacter nataicola]